MACGTPVVASRVGGLPEVITHGETGFLHAPGDLDGMAASALALLTDSALRDRLSRAARATIVERYCEERIVPMYEEFYARLIGAADAPAPAVGRAACGRALAATRRRLVPSLRFGSTARLDRRAACVACPAHS